MRRSVRILEEASQEAIEAASWYEYRQPGLGAEFFAVVDAALDIIEENLISLSPLRGASDIKHLVLDRFPYDILVLDSPEEAIVIAVAHHSRKPGYWRERKTK